MSLPTRYMEDTVEFTIANVGATAVSKQLTELVTADNYIIKDIELFFSGTPLEDALIHLNSAATDAAATRFGGRYYQTGSFLHYDSDENGKLRSPVSTKPYLYVSAGVGSVSQTVYGTVHYYAWSP